MFGAIFFGLIAFVVWASFTILKLLAVAGWWVLSRLFKLDRHTNVPGSKPIGFYFKRAMVHHRARVRARKSAGAPATQWAREDAIEARRAFMAGEMVSSIALRMNHTRASVLSLFKHMGLISTAQEAAGIENYLGMDAGLGLQSHDPATAERSPASLRSRAVCRS